MRDRPDTLPAVPAHIERLVPYSPGKPIEELERELGITGAIKLASNECPTPPSASVLAAIAQSARESNRYPDASAFWLKKDLAAFHGVTESEIALGNGSNELIDILCRTFAGPEDHAVIGSPSFVCYRLGLVTANVPFTEVELDDLVAWNAAKLLQAVTPKTKLLFIANPNNPTGGHMCAADLEKILRQTPPSVVVVLDEAYVQFADALDYRSAIDPNLRPLRERLIVLRTFSKAYALAGLRVGYAIGPSDLIGYIERVRAPFNVNLLAQAAARAALRDTDAVSRYVQEVTRERPRVKTALEAIGMKVAPSQANFVLAHCGGRPGTRVYDALLRKGVIVRPMPPPISEWLRITIGSPDENSRLIAAMAEALEKSAI